MGRRVATVQPALEKFYGLLTDEQKERITAFGPGAAARPQRRRARPELQRRAGERDRLADRRHRAHGASDRGATRESHRAAGRRRQSGPTMLKAVCPAEEPAHAAGTARGGRPAARHLAASRQDRDRAGSTTSTACYDDEQRARFNAISPAPTSQADHPRSGRRVSTGNGFPSIGGFIRHILRFF